jgi:2-polyprenyl-6-hydroxyphenyl methylase/3-demethylubiquinone-9 3-methyltransferase
MALNSPSVNLQEVEKFSRIAEEWWDENGKFKPLHKFNPTRLSYIINTLKNYFERADIKGLKIADIGCGGGLLSIPLARLGADVTGIDASEQNIKVAKLHAEKEEVGVNYLHTSAEELAASGEKFDAVLVMEIIEHVEDVASFMQACSQLVKDGGLILVATINRTTKSYLNAIIGAEYVLRWLPRGTHEWKKFLKPHEINNEFEKNGISFIEAKGVNYSLIKDQFSLTDDLSVNFMVLGKK